jgi:hypothetical protein
MWQAVQGTWDGNTIVCDVLGVCISEAAVGSQVREAGGRLGGAF